jgi:hypothetical protein
MIHKNLNFKKFEKFSDYYNEPGLGPKNPNTLKKSLNSCQIFRFRLKKLPEEAISLVKLIAKNKEFNINSVTLI